MSYEQKNTAVGLFSTTFLLGYYLLNVMRIYQTGTVNPKEIYILWGVVIVVGILTAIIASILTQIVLNIVHTIRTQQEEPARFFSDERDNIIELKGSRNALYLLSIGLLIAMLSLVIGQPPLVMFNLLVVSAFLSAIFGDLSRLFYYQRGF